MNEHNPIAHLVTKIQQTWTNEISSSPELALVRWMICEEEAKLYEGFLHLESTSHGAIPEVFIVLMCPFVSKESFSKELTKTWLDMMDEDEKTLHFLKEQEVPFQWDRSLYENEGALTSTQSYQLFLKLIAGFRAACGIEEKMINVVLMPHQIAHIESYMQWLEELLSEGLPDLFRLCIFDHKEENYFAPLFEKVGDGYARTLSPELDVQGAIDKIMQGGDLTHPGTKLRKYIHQMSKATAGQDLKKLNQLGDQCLQDMRRAKDRVLLSTAYLSFAGMLFQFKAYDQIQELLKQGLIPVQSGIKEENPTCRALLIQYLNFLGTSYQLSKNYPQAINHYLLGADAAIQAGQEMQAISSYRLASNLALKHRKKLVAEILEKAYSLKDKLSEEEIRICGFIGIAKSYCEWHENRETHEQATKADQEMAAVFGEDWRKSVEEEASATHNHLQAV